MIKIICFGHLAPSSKLSLYKNLLYFFPPPSLPFYYLQDGRKVVVLEGSGAAL